MTNAHPYRYNLRNAAVRLIVILFAVLWTVGPLAAAEFFWLEEDYEEYLQIHAGQPRPDRVIVIPAVQYSEAEPAVRLLWNHDGSQGLSVWIPEDGYIQWQVWVPEAGLYNIELDYYPAPGRSSEIQRELRINGEVPFAGARFLSLRRVWVDEQPIRMDNRGNEIRARMVEAPQWQTAYLRDDMGYFMEPYLFYFEAGSNTIRLDGKREPVIIQELRLRQAPPVPAYADVQQTYDEQGLEPTSGLFLKVQGQSSTQRSDPTLYPIFDQGDPTVEPYHPALIRLNTIGGWRWQNPGQWIEWELDIPEEGLYQIAIKAKQNEKRGSFSNRRLLINGEVPFAEVDVISFPFDNQYQMLVLGAPEQGEPYLFHFTEGTHTLRLEVVLGPIADMLRTAEESLFHLNDMYRKILMITSANPDTLRDYQLDRRIPGVIENLGIQADIITELADELEAYTGQRAGNVALLRNLARQLEDLSTRPHTIPNRLGAYRDNIASLGAWIIDTREQPLQIDYLLVASPDQPVPSARATAAQMALHEIRAFVSSFFVDYGLIGDVHDDVDQEPITVWISTGRDQATALKEMIEDTFTAETGILVNLQLVNMGVLLPATLAGLGPDVALGVPASDPINFALRSAVVDLTEFAGFDEVKDWFMPSAFVPFTFRNQVFALPEQQPFPMLFYRLDILNELGLEIPQTWDDVMNLIPDLQKENMNFGMPVTDQRARQAGSGDIGVATSGAGSLASHQAVMSFLTFLYQSGGDLYNLDGVSVQIDSELAIEAFRLWTELYELYNLPLQYDPANRFRIGEVPVVVASYPLYNYLSVFAPEIRGRWGFTLVPGTEREDGTIDRSLPGGAVDLGAGAAAMILQDARDKDAAWEFLRWWVQEDTQVRFGRELESLLGPAARYPTANVNAMASLPWTVSERDILLEQWQHVRGVPEVPGGYMIGRHLENAFRRVVLLKEEPRKTLLDYVRIMNEEIAVKRREFGLETTMEEVLELYSSQPWQMSSYGWEEDHVE